MFIPGTHWTPVKPFSPQPVGHSLPPSPKFMNKVGPPPAKSVSASALPPSKPTDSVTISSAAQAKAATSLSTVPSTASGLLALDQNCAYNPSATGLPQDQRSLTVAHRDTRQDSENEDDDEGNDEDGNINVMVGHNSDGGEDALQLPQRVSMSASTQATSNSPQGLSRNQNDDGRVISQNPLDGQKTEPILHQSLPSDPRVEQILRDLKGLLADLEKV